MEDHFGMNILLDATLGPNGANPDVPPSSLAVASGLHQCRVCKRTYERADHLNRHLKSHENARPFHCSRCPKRFNRADLLSRHLATHERHSNRDPDRPLIRRTDRAAEACLACAASKSKCEDQKPCRRCRTKNINCETATSSFAAQARRSSVRTSTISSAECDDTSQAQADQTTALNPPNFVYRQSSTATDRSPGTYNTERIAFAPSGKVSKAPAIAQTRNFANANISSQEMPSTALSESARLSMNTDVMSFDDTIDMLFLPNVSEFNQDLDFGFRDFNFEGVHLASPDTGADRMRTEHSTPFNQATSSKLSRDVARGYVAFKHSPWLWTPAQKDHQLDRTDIALDEASISPGRTPSSAISVSVDVSNLTPRLNAGLRDEMFALIVMMTMPMNKLAKSAVPIFPSLDIINHIIHVFFVRQSYQVDHWMHAPTFVPAKSRPQLLLALISAGSVFISVPAVWKMGLALQEVVRLAIAELWEGNNKNIRDLQALQAFMLCLDVGLWSGFKRKMEIAESFGQLLITMLRRAGVFSAPRDSEALIPDPSDSGDLLESKWRKWVERESFKRLAIHLLLHDTRASVVLQKPPLLPFTELTFSLPASRDLWLADTALKWKTRYLAKGPLNPASIPKLMDAMHDTTLLDIMHDHVDSGLCSIALLHGFWGQIWAFQECSKFRLANQPEQGSATHRVLLTAQHRELYQDIDGFAAKVSDLAEQPSGIVIVAELFMMALHVSPDELQRFSGKAGEEEASRASTALQKWIQTADARRAAWHAGQVLRSAKAMPPAELRDFYAIAVYFAGLALWAYGIMSGSPDPQDSYGQSVPPRSQEQRNNSVHVSLDGPETRETRAFLSLDQGVPGLSYPYAHGETVFESLENPNVVLEMVREIYRNNFPALEEPLPPLVENLGNLMRDLSSSPGSRFSRSGSEGNRYR